MIRWNSQNQYLRKHLINLMLNSFKRKGIFFLFYRVFNFKIKKLILKIIKCALNEIHYCTKINIFFLFQLTYADTHPMYTNENYPNFFRVVPSETAFNPARVALLRHYNWTRVGTLYQNSPRYALVSIWYNLLK